LFRLYHDNFNVTENDGLRATVIGTHGYTRGYTGAFGYDCARRQPEPSGGAAWMLKSDIRCDTFAALEQKLLTRKAPKTK
jgi:hypothetical protein